MNRNFAQTLQSAACVLLASGAVSMAAPRIACAFAYVGNQAGGTVSVIDTDRDEVTRTLPDHGKIGGKVQAVIADHAEKTAFVVDADSNALVIVDVASGQIEQRVDVGQAPEGASLSPSGKTIAVCVENDNAVTLVDVAKLRILRKIPTRGKNPEHCAFSPDERWLMTSNELSDDVDIIDLKTARSTGSVHTSGHPRAIAWLPRQQIAYVAQETAGGVDVVDAAKRKVIQSILTGLRPAGAIASPDGKQVFVSNGGDATISVIDTASRNVVATIPVGKRPWNLALTHDGRKLYVANGRSNSVSVIDTVTLRVIKTIAVGELPWGVSIP
jgi:YVTN family beta-propeller protein